MLVVLRTHGDGFQAWIIAYEPLDAGDVVNRMNFRRCDQRAGIGCQVAGQKRRDKGFALIDEVAQRTGEVIAAQHQEHFDAVIDEQFPRTCQGLIALEFGVVNDDLDLIPAIADPDAALLVHPILPDEATRLALARWGM